MLSHCKINLGLKVIGRRPQDGYHLIESIFVPIDVGDEIHIQTAPSSEHTFQLKSENQLDPRSRAYLDFESVSERGNPEANLLYRVWQKCVSFIENPVGVIVELIKKTPPGSGIGQGSSNAAMLLLHLIETGRITQKTAFDVALQCGADIPFFLQRKPALVTGIGEQLEPLALDGLYALHGILCFPGISVNTGTAYTQLKKPLQHSASQQKGFLLSQSSRVQLQSGHFDKLELENEFESVVFTMHPQLEELKASFLEHCVYSAMSGSGSAVYGLFSKETKESQKQAALAVLQKKHPGLLFKAFRTLKQ